MLGTSQFEVDGLAASSTVIPAENLQLLMLENVLRLYMAEITTSTSLYQHWLAAGEAGQQTMDDAGHRLDVAALEPNGMVPYLMDTPSTEDKVQTRGGRARGEAWQGDRWTPAGQRKPSAEVLRRPVGRSIAERPGWR